MKFAVVVFPGSNCDHDCYHVIKNVLRQPVEYVWHKNTRLDGFDCVILPGGFSYGDYLRCGAVARFSPVLKPIVDFANGGGLVIGICNGFQVLLESGLLPGAMLRNTTTHFICKFVDIRTENTGLPFTNRCRSGQVLQIPVAHNDGNYYIDEDGLKRLHDNNQVAFRYCSGEGNVSAAFCPNGSVDNIAGITNEKGNVLGMMPHPERCAESILNSDDGRLIFESIANQLETR